jgi:hypothetical protein
MLALKGRVDSSVASDGDLKVSLEYARLPFVLNANTVLYRTSGWVRHASQPGKQAIPSMP